MAIAPPKRMVQRSTRRGKVRAGRPLPPPRATKIEQGDTTPEPLKETPVFLDRLSPKPQNNNIPRTIQSLHEQMEAWMAAAFTKMGAPELIGRIPWEWNARMTSTMGRAHFHRVLGTPHPKKMDFAPRLFKRATVEEQRQTVYHECAHIVDYHKGTYNESHPHGPSWSRYMHRAGVAPKRTHNVMPIGRIEVWCLCKIHYVTKRMHASIRAGAVRRCKRCGSKVTTVKPKE